MFTIKNFTDNDDIRTLETKGAFTVIEYLRDLSVTAADAQVAYFSNEMNVRKRQVICDVSKANITPSRAPCSGRWAMSMPPPA